MNFIDPFVETFEILEQMKNEQSLAHLGRLRKSLLKCRINRANIISELERQKLRDGYRIGPDELKTLKAMSWELNRLKDVPLGSSRNLGMSEMLNWILGFSKQPEIDR